MTFYIITNATEQIATGVIGSLRLPAPVFDVPANANGLAGKTGVGTDAPALYRAGRIKELLNYCETDTRLVSDLYHMGRYRGYLQVEPFYHGLDRERIYLLRTTIPPSL